MAGVGTFPAAAPVAAAAAATCSDGSSSSAGPPGGGGGAAPVTTSAPGTPPADPASHATACAAECHSAVNAAGVRFGDVYTIAEPVGSGTWSTVWRVVRRRSRATFAAKVVPRGGEGYNPSEAALLRAARHPNIVQLHDVFASERVEVLVMELLAGEELFGRVKASAAFGEAEARSVMAQLLSALSFLHNQLNVVHRDVKLENMILCSNSATGQPVLKLVDFGFASVLPSAAESAAAAANTADGAAAAVEQRLHRCCGSPNYVSPEMLRASRSQHLRQGRRCYYGCEVDVWAAGVVLFVLLCRRYPFYHEKRSQWYRQLWRGEYTLPAAGLSGEARDLIAGMLEVDPARRLTAADALSHRWFRHIPLRAPPATPPTGPIIWGRRGDANAAASTTALTAAEIGSAADRATATTPTVLWSPKAAAADHPATPNVATPLKQRRPRPPTAAGATVAAATATPSGASTSVVGTPAAGRAVWQLRAAAVAAADVSYDPLSPRLGSR